MLKAADQYLSQKKRKEIVSAANHVWIIAIIFSSLWILMIIAPAFLGYYSCYSSADYFYDFLGKICHQMPSRSLFLFGQKLGVCSRCTGVYVGIFFGFVVYPLFWKRTEIYSFNIAWLFLASLPIAIDWGLTAFGIWENTMLSRFVTGMILGMTCSIFLMPAFVELNEIKFLRMQKRKNWKN